MGAEVVMRHIFKATLQQLGMMSERVCKRKLLRTINVMYEGWPGRKPTAIAAMMMQL